MLKEILIGLGVGIVIVAFVTSWAIILSKLISGRKP